MASFFFFSLSSLSCQMEETILSNLFWDENSFPLGAGGQHNPGGSGRPACPAGQVHVPAEQREADPAPPSLPPPATTALHQPFRGWLNQHHFPYRTYSTILWPNMEGGKFVGTVIHWSKTFDPVLFLCAIKLGLSVFLNPHCCLVVK